MSYYLWDPSTHHVGNDVRCSYKFLFPFSCRGSSILSKEAATFTISKVFSSFVHIVCVCVYCNVTTGI